MAIPYPFGLGTILVSSKQRSQAAKFGMTDPKRGPGYVQEIGTDMPVFWTATFKHPKKDAQRFKLWFDLPEYLNGGIEEAIIPIGTEFGVIDHVCKFLPNSLLNTSQDGGVFTYTATITSRKLLVPQEAIDMGSYIVENMMDVNDWALIDYAFNDERPT